MKRYSKDPYCRCSMEPNAQGAWVMFDDVKPLALPLTNTAADGEVKGDVREFRQMLADCAQYLKEGETPAQRIERERRDTEAVLNLLIREKQKTERMSAALRDLVALENMRLRLHSLHERGHGTDYADYHRLLPLAWDAARMALGPNARLSGDQQP